MPKPTCSWMYCTIHWLWIVTFSCKYVTLDFSRSLLEHILEKKNNVSIAKVLLSNGAIVELDNEQSKKELSWSEFSFVVSNLVDDNTAHITGNVLRHVCSLKKQRNQSNTLKSKELPFLSQEFHCNKKTTILVIIFWDILTLDKMFATRPLQIWFV